MEIQSLKVSTRQAQSKNAAGRLRTEGQVPCVLYGGGKDPISLAFDAKEFMHLMRAHSGEHAVLQLDVADSPELSSPALLKQIQHHPLRGQVVHVDFLRIRLDERIQTKVTVEVVGHAKGIVDGGVLDHQLREVEIECLATEIPEVLTVDITDLGLGDSLHVAKLQAPEGVTILTDADRTIVAIHQPRVAKTAEEEAAEAEEAAEGAEEAAAE